MDIINGFIVAAIIILIGAWAQKRIAMSSDARSEEVQKLIRDAVRQEMVPVTHSIVRAVTTEIHQQAVLENLKSLMDERIKMKLEEIKDEKWLNS